MKKTALVLTLAALGFAAAPSFAQESPWLVRVRAINLSPADKSDPVGGVGASDRIHVSSKTIPDLDVTYFFNEHCAAELVLTYPQKHDVLLDGSKIGTFKHLPPTLTFQYHFAPAAQISPYLGAGINYTNISSVDLGPIGLDHSSTGLALQAGVDFKLDKKWSVNLDVKKVQIRSDVTAGGAKISRVEIDPVLFGVGVGYRF
jgi:outer membrane protein